MFHSADRNTGTSNTQVCIRRHHFYNNTQRKPKESRGYTVDLGKRPLLQN
jgi:hypothetical protein